MQELVASGIGAVALVIVVRGVLRFTGEVVRGGPLIIYPFSTFLSLLVARPLVSEFGLVGAYAIGLLGGFAAAVLIIIGLIARQSTQTFPMALWTRGCLVGVGFAILAFGVWFGLETGSPISAVGWIFPAFLIPVLLLTAIEVPKVMRHYLTWRLSEIDANPDLQKSIDGDPIARGLHRMARRALSAQSVGDPRALD